MPWCTEPPVIWPSRAQVTSSTSTPEALASRSSCRNLAALRISGVHQIR